MKGPFLRAEQVRTRNHLKINQKTRQVLQVRFRTGRETLPGPQKGMIDLGSGPGPLVFGSGSY